MMKSPTKLDTTRLSIFHEGKKRRIFVGELLYNKDSQYYELVYDKDYAHSKSAIPLSPSLSLFKLKHKSEKGKLFPVFMDRIPERSNPAYEDYCASEGISSNEKNPIILLGTIGKRGPSSFIFEPVYFSEFTISEILKIREELQISQQDLALAFNINRLTLVKLETGKSKDPNTLKLLQIYFQFPEVALWELKKTGRYINSHVLARLTQYFKSKLTSPSPQQSTKNPLK